MSGAPMDFIDRYFELEKQVRDLQRRPSSYLESVIVGGEFTAATIVPPFFTPFGGAILSILGRTISGNADVDIEVNASVIATLILADDGSVTQEELDPPIYLNEGDQVQVVITGSDAPSEGLSVGVIIHP